MAGVAGRTYPDEEWLFDEGFHVACLGNSAGRGKSIDSSNMFSGFRSVWVICSLSWRKASALRLCEAKLWMSCSQKPLKLFLLRKS